MQPSLILAVAIALLAAVLDWRKGEIPNWLTLPALVVGPVLHFAASLKMGTNAAASEAGISIAGAILCAVVPMLLYRQNAIGGGDVKLFAAIGALCQPMVGIEAEMYGFLAAAVVAPVRLAYEGKLFRTMKNALYVAMNPILPKEKRQEIEPEAMSWFRLGPAIFVGTLLTALLHWRDR